MFFLKYLTWSLASLGQNLLLKFKNTCTSAEQSIPLKDLPPHLYLIFLKEVIFLKGFFSLYVTGLTSLFFSHPFLNFPIKLKKMKFLLLLKLKWLKKILNI